MDNLEFYYCADCTELDCDCGGGFHEYDEEELEPECPCCGGQDVAP